MKKITLALFIFLICMYAGIAQDTCATATAITAGTYNVTAVNGTEGTTTICSGGTTTAAAAEWYTYTPTTSGSATVSSDILPTNANGDTRLQIYEGTCGALVCVSGNDDVDYPGGNYLSEATFNTTANTTYYIVWDNRWSSFGFEFTLTEATAVCLDPSGFVGDAATTTTFDLSWTDTNTGTPTWEIEWGADGFTQGTGTLVSNIAVTSYQFTGLTANTNYDFFIRANCGGINGDSSWVGPIGFRSQRDCTGSAAYPFSEDFLDGTILDCWGFEDADMISPVWSYNTDTNDLDGDGTNDSFMVVFPQAVTEVAKNDWLFSQRLDMTTANTYGITVTYNAFDLNTTSDESFELYITDGQSSTALYQSLLGTYTGITQSGVFGDMGGNDLLSQAYNITVPFTPPSDGTYYIAVRATTTNSPNLLMLFNVGVTETLGVEEVAIDNFKHIINYDTKTLTLQASENMSEFTLFTSLGQQVLNTTLNSNTHVANLNSLDAGVYFARVNAANKTKTFKIIVK
ncbi:T9SS type A sorting domain-containing protein [Kordia jejudonensis]|uniref:T9SS type A sorting domain-containing protein n=1 Tax=Kordia jejudonensis TaxID=1348245 RepID=UPI0006297E85|nr:T9SS type A sorting domain-containing protein [Kordia jejudonensis]